MWPRRLGAPFRDTVVADHRRREADDLPGKARVGDDLLVAGHRGREDGLADRKSVSRNRLAAEDGAVLEREKARHLANTTRPAAIVVRTAPFTVAPSSQELTDRERNVASVMR